MKYNVLRIIFLVAVLSESVTAIQRSSPSKVGSLPTGDWVKHRLSIKDKNDLRRRFQEGVDRRAIPGGSLMIVHKGEVIFSEAFGLADIEKRRPFTTNDLCRLASVTKPHTATVIAMLTQVPQTQTQRFRRRVMEKIEEIFTN